MLRNEIITSLETLGKMLEDSSFRKSISEKASLDNPWFSENHVDKALQVIGSNFLDLEALNDWIGNYESSRNRKTKTVALIMAGNIPAVGFHDLLCVLISGNIAQVKLSSKDRIVIPMLVERLIEINSAIEDRIDFVERVNNFDAIIATGSNNTLVHFKHYFGAYPHILRGNRSSVAVIDKNYSKEFASALATDMLVHFGLGCRNVSKLHIHKSIDLTDLMELWHENKSYISHNKYKNNYDYNYTILLMNGANFLMNSCLLLLEEKTLHSPISVINYELFDDLKEVEDILEGQFDELQCVVSSSSLNGIKTTPVGQTQSPKLNDYADHVDTMEFLLSI